MARRRRLSGRPARPARRRLSGRVLAAGLAVATAAGCSGGKGTPPRAGRPSTATSAATAAPPTTVARPRGGTVTVGVTGEPDPGAPTLAGAGVRALVLPQLFVAGPDGTWEPSLVEPGSDAVSADGRVATFRIRPGAAWSDATPITAGDLERSADKGLVTSVAADGERGVRVQLVAPVPDWRRLWSGLASVSPPKPGVWGGPFVVAARTPGLETILRRNDHWWGAPAPWLDEVRLVLVPDSTTQRQLLARGRLDVIAPLAATHRIEQLRATAGTSVATGDAGPGGWWFGLLADADRLGDDDRAAVRASVPLDAFATRLLAGEAVAGGPDGGGGVGALAGDTVTLTGEVEDPMTALLERAMQQRVRAAGGTMELRNAESDRVEGWVAAGEFQAALLWRYDPAGPPPATPDDATSTVLWRPRPIVAWRTATGLHGARPNRFGLSPAWDAAGWWLERP